ncbi:tyrosine-type recombinase/integrase [Streptomyces eurythermus]|uniref:tyrosine-type recombinase/integrase n=1 Tax=Streptomyces eurythermus TaxID=42237 RepID=UPI0033D239CF
MDPRDGSITLADYIAKHWAPGTGGVPKTQDNRERRTRLHIVPHLGQLPLRSITASDLRAYIAKLDATVDSVDYQRGILSELSSILEAAVDDKRLARNPMHAKSVRWPKAPEERREAWPLERALRVRDAISPRNRIAVVLGLGCGLRQGEVFGLSPEDIDYARGVIHVRRQVQALKGRLYFALPKGSKTRTVDMPSSVAEDLKRHVEAFPPVEVELPWGKPEAGGQRRKFSLLLTTRFGNAIAVNTWNTYTWKPALAKAGIIPPRPQGAKQWQWAAAPKDGFHVLRHTYASIMLEGGSPWCRWRDGSGIPLRLSPFVTMLTSCRRLVSRGARPSTGCWGERDTSESVVTSQILRREAVAENSSRRQRDAGPSMRWTRGVIDMG